MKLDEIRKRWLNAVKPPEGIETPGVDAKRDLLDVIDLVDKVLTLKEWPHSVRGVVVTARRKLGLSIRLKPYGDIDD